MIDVDHKYEPEVGYQGEPLQPREFPIANRGHANPRYWDVINAGYAKVSSNTLFGARECRDVIRIGYVIEDAKARRLKPPQSRTIHSDPYHRKFKVQFKKYEDIVEEKGRPFKDVTSTARDQWMIERDCCDEARQQGKQHSFFIYCRSCGKSDLFLSLIHI